MEFRSPSGCSLHWCRCFGRIPTSRWSRRFRSGVGVGAPLGMSSVISPASSRLRTLGVQIGSKALQTSFHFLQPILIYCWKPASDDA
ncbi:hypothetical protein EJB05_36854, partial [Eragrostis curvula]